MSDPRARRLPVAVVIPATALVLVGVAVAIFFEPAWLSFEQARAGADRATGYTIDEVNAATGAILHDLVVGPPDFAVAVRDEPVLDARERGHMRDVRAAFIGFGAATLAAVAILVGAHRLTRGSPAFWRAVRIGARATAVTVVALGVVAAVAFDAAFEVFHRLFFTGGTYTFDPRTERLVQLFPDQFWYETSLALGLVVAVLSAVTAIVATRRAARDAVSAR